MNSEPTNDKNTDPTPLGLYLRLAREVLPTCPPDDRIEVLKGACARLRIPYTSKIIRDVVDRVAGLPEIHRPPIKASHAPARTRRLSRATTTLGDDLAAVGATPRSFPTSIGPRQARKWTQVDRVTHCGRCGRDCLIGAPVLVLVVGDGWRKVRCAECAGEPVPATLAADVAAGPDPQSRADRVEAMRRRAYERLTRQTPLDVWPSREPGEEG
jgi:hypothetical protein